MNEASVVVLISCLCLAIYAAIHAFIFKVFSPKKRWNIIRNLYFIMLPLVVCFSLRGVGYLEEIEMPNNDFLWVNLAVCLWVLLLIHVGYLTFYGFIDRSITLRAFIEIKKSGGKPLTFPELANQYDTGQAYLRRLEILKEAGYLVDCGRKSGDFELTSKGRKLGSLIRWLKRFYNLGPGG